MLRIAQEESYGKASSALVADDIDTLVREVDEKSTAYQFGYSMGPFVSEILPIVRKPQH